MGLMPSSLPTLRVSVLLLLLATVLLISTSPANANFCSGVSCVDVSSPACKFCNRRAGKRSDSYAWRDGRDQENANNGEKMTSECYLDNMVASLPHDLQEQVFEVLEVVLGITR